MEKGSKQLLDELDSLENLHTNLAILKSQVEIGASKCREKSSEIHRLISSGHTTGDPFRDFVIYWAERYKWDPIRSNLSSLQRLIAHKKGQLVLAIFRREIEKPRACLDLGLDGCLPASYDQAVDMCLGRLTDSCLIIDVKQYLIQLPTGSYVRWSEKGILEAAKPGPIGSSPSGKHFLGLFEPVGRWEGRGEDLPAVCDLEHAPTDTRDHITSSCFFHYLGENKRRAEVWVGDKEVEAFFPGCMKERIFSKMLHLLG